MKPSKHQCRVCFCWGQPVQVPRSLISKGCADNSSLAEFAGHGPESPERRMDFCARTEATKGLVRHRWRAGLEGAGLEGPAQLQSAGHRNEAEVPERFQQRVWNP